MNLLQHIAQSRHLLRKSELKVADHVLLDPAAVMHSSMADLAHSVGISEPTIVRFCRAIGCTGFQDLKLKLAQSLAAGASFGQFAIHEDDSVADFSLKIFDTTLHTLIEVREKLDPKALQHAIAACSQAQRVEFYGFGASGAVAADAQHKFFRLHADTRILALARSPKARAAFQALAERRCRAQVARADFDAATWASFAERLDYFPIDASQSADFSRLARHLGPVGERVQVYYLATAPDLFEDIARHLNIAGLAGPNARIVLEKPIGHSLESARSINAAIGAAFDESRVFRIDHYLGKETVQNLMALRFANMLFEPLWRSGHIDHVQISVCETLGVENRGAYYDRSGAMRDMVQNHLLQLLCLVAMEAPAQFNAESVRDEKLKILQALKPIQGMDVHDKTVRGQYTAGKIGGQEVPAYYFEKNVDNDSDTETFVALQVAINTWRWAGVPFYLRTGKRMAKKTSEIVIHFKQVPHLLFDNTQPNRLIIRLQPEERISLQLMGKTPGKGMRLAPVELDLNLAQAFHQKRRWDAYERLLLDVIEGDSTLFMRRDEVEAAWKWVDPILKGWQDNYQDPRPYAAGSNGPEQAQSLLELQGRKWAE